MIRAAFLATVGLLFASPAMAATQVILVGNLIPDAGTGATGPATITVTDGRITNIAKGYDRADRAADITVIDLSTKTVLPDPLWAGGAVRGREPVISALVDISIIVRHRGAQRAEIRSYFVKFISAI